MKKSFSQWVRSPQRSSVSANQIWLDKTDFWIPNACWGVKKDQLFSIPYSNVSPIRKSTSLEKIYSSISQNIRSNFTSLRIKYLLSERPNKVTQNRYRDNFWKQENYSIRYEKLLSFVAYIEMFGSIFRRNFKLHGSMFPQTNSEIAKKTQNAILLYKMLVADSITDQLKECQLVNPFREKSQKSIRLLWCTKYR